MDQHCQSAVHADDCAGILFGVHRKCVDHLLCLQEPQTGGQVSAVAPLAAPASASAPSTGGKPQPQGAGCETNTAVDAIPAAASGKDRANEVGPYVSIVWAIVGITDVSSLTSS